MFTNLLGQTINLLLWGLIWPLGFVAIISFAFNFIFSLFQVQEQTLLYLIKITVAAIAILVFFPSWNLNFINFIQSCLEQIIIIGGN